ncbi:ribbon-helix-helix domain-containing protein [Methylobacterium sp. J-088]|uniref:ribbon-helix-helix domain-containing protein n=1 Tax=Methylobacterium sp. J-088 TaxID=2836664 RepID=UPI001FBBFDA4|nr:ribbon-helix-helix domain-containing protein [Methylobacterium sp. J-088]MCJ2062612.1 ribbon-helix-helix domain-containing protein [Methylobacterium sp. J-088]
MSKAPRPTLDSLAGRFARKDPPAVTANVISEPPAVAEPVGSPAGLASTAAATVKAKADARVQILTRIDPATRKRLKVIAAEQERTIQEICEEAIRDFVARHSK